MFCSPIKFVYFNHINTLNEISFSSEIDGFKCDLVKENLSNKNEQLDDFCKDKGFDGWYETSAKDDINVEGAAKFLVSKILEKEKQFKNEEEKIDENTISISNNTNAKKEKKCCS